MAVAKNIEIISGSKTSFDDAIKQGIARSGETVNNITGAWVKDQSLIIESGKITEYRVLLVVTFLLKAATQKKKK